MPRVFCQALLEGSLEEPILKRMLVASGRELELAQVFGQTGHGYVMETAAQYSSAATANNPLIVLLDQETAACAPSIVNQMFPNGTPNHTLIGVAVRMSEAWLMGDREGLASFLGISANRFPELPETLEHSKKELLTIIQRHGRESTKSKFVREDGGTQGPEYVSEISHFIREQWNISRAKTRCPSLDRFIRRLADFDIAQ